MHEGKSAMTLIARAWSVKGCATETAGAFKAAASEHSIQATIRSSFEGKSM